ncbi:helix-turn-helix transcriptional regulator [Rhodococcus sp. NPDC004095]
MTPASRAGARLQAAIHDAKSTATDAVDFRSAALEAILAVVPSDCSVLAPVDPAIVVPTAATTVGFADQTRACELAFALEYGTTPPENSYVSLLRRRRGIRTIGEATGGSVRESRTYRELLAPLGLSDHLRMVFRGRDGLCWGVGDLIRGPGSGFTDDEVDVLAGVLRDVGEGMRSTLLRQAPQVCAEVDGGPAMVLVGPDNEFELVTPAARDFFARLDWGPPDGLDRMAPVVVAAIRQRTLHSDSITLRTRTTDGEWVVIRVGRLDRRATGRVVLTFERAQFPEIVSLVVAAYGLTAREAEVLAQVFAGRTREQIGRRLHISPYTVQDHLKSIFAKTGVNSCLSLVARLVYTEYRPRLGAPVGPDGWFVAGNDRSRNGSPVMT